MPRRRVLGPKQEIADIVSEVKLAVKTNLKGPKLVKIGEEVRRTFSKVSKRARR